MPSALIKMTDSRLFLLFVPWLAQISAKINAFSGWKSFSILIHGRSSHKGEHATKICWTETLLPEYFVGAPSLLGISFVVRLKMRIKRTSSFAQLSGHWRRWWWRSKRWIKKGNNIHLLLILSVDSQQALCILYPFFLLFLVLAVIWLDWVRACICHEFYCTWMVFHTQSDTHIWPTKESSLTLFCFLSERKM